MTEKIKLSDLIYEVRSRKLQPSQIFTRDEFEKDPEFGKIIKNEADYNHPRYSQEMSLKRIRSSEKS